MEWYLTLKHLHMSFAGVSIGFFLLRASLDLLDKPNWRRGFMRIFPHVNDTMLLVCAIALVMIGPWQLAEQGWLIGKIILLLAYIGLGKVALSVHRSKQSKALFSLLALGCVGAIVGLAVIKPVF